MRFTVIGQKAHMGGGAELICFPMVAIHPACHQMTFWFERAIISGAIPTAETSCSALSS